MSRLVPGNAYSETILNMFMCFCTLLVTLLDNDRPGGAEPSDAFRTQIRSTFAGTLILCGKYSAADAAESIGQGKGDAVAVGCSCIASPELAARFRRGGSLKV